MIIELLGVEGFVWLEGLASCVFGFRLNNNNIGKDDPCGVAVTVDS